MNGGTYQLPFNIPIPQDLVPSFELSPVEQSLIDVTYFIEVVVKEKTTPGTDKKDKK